VERRGEEGEEEEEEGHETFSRYFLPF